MRAFHNPLPIGERVPSVSEAVRGYLQKTFVIFLCTILSISAHAAPQRIVSMYPCLDTLVVRLADREQIAALSYYARSPQSSTVADIAETLPVTYGSAEEVIALDPDLVVTSQYVPRETTAALKRLKIPMAAFDVPLSVAASLDQVRAVADAVGHPARGLALALNIEAALAQSAPPPGAPPISVLVFQANGFAAGRGVLIDELLTRTGFVNVGARYQFGQFGIVSLERIIADPPQALLAGAPAPRAKSWADRIIAHPALRTSTDRMARVNFPENLLLCGGPVIPETVKVLAEARNRIRETAP